MSVPGSEIKFHDPLIVREAGSYYCFSTDTHLKGVQIAKSEDLLHWELLKTALPAFPEPVVRHTRNQGFWAPEVVRVGAEYRLYCCASSFGTSQSVISLATAPSLEADFVYQGDVLRTYHTGRFDTPNAIDPNVVADREGRLHMVYGSFFGGIYIAPLDESGFLAEPGYGTRIAGGQHTAVEGGYIHYSAEHDRYYLFVSYGSLTYDYNIRVGQAQDLHGPYLDSQGHDLCDLDPIRSVGDKLAGGYNFDLPGCEGRMGPGHNSLAALDDGLYVVHHIRKEFEVRQSYLHLRKLFWLDNGQVFLSPVPRDETLVEAGGSLPDFISLVRFDRFNNGVTYGRKLAVKDLALTTTPEGELTLALYGSSYRGLVLRHGEEVYLSAVSETGECLWGRGF